MRADAATVDDLRSCQAHVLGDAVVPQKLRSLRKVRARPASLGPLERPAKQQCKSAPSGELNEADIAQMLLGLGNCHSPDFTPPRESDVSTEEEEFLPISPTRRRPTSRTHAKSVRAPAAQALTLEKGTSEELEEESAADSHFPSRSTKSTRKLPGRCKCGKRVSASHPPCKSELMLLCERFCTRCGHLSASGEPTRIHLNDCAVALGVPRRRLYDITIVYEAVEVVKRTGKLSYVWLGMQHLPALIEQLKKEEEEGVPVTDRKTALPQQQGERQTTHSLWNLSRKFIRLLLTKKGPIQLTDAAEHLIGERFSAKRQQTQVTVERRLYDIGSILATLNLIHRTYVEGKRQPAFSWNWDWSRNSPDAANLQHDKDMPVSLAAKLASEKEDPISIAQSIAAVPHLPNPTFGTGPQQPAVSSSSMQARLSGVWSMSPGSVVAKAFSTSSVLPSIPLTQSKVYQSPTQAAGNDLLPLDPLVLPIHRFAAVPTGHIPFWVSGPHNAPQVQS